jgi:Archaeal IMP cyclohydrolase
MTNLYEYLSRNSYPGRGIAVGKSPDGAAIMAVYFIMGRSENSRNRIFSPTADGIQTKAFDESKLTDPSLIIYHPVRKVSGTTIVTNGDQTDTIAQALVDGKGYTEALRTRTFEPDAPIYTPRISAVIEADGRYAISILKSYLQDGETTVRSFFEYDGAPSAAGHLIHTYQENTAALPSFAGEPIAVVLDEDCPKALGHRVWGALDKDNRVALFCRRISLTDGEGTDFVVNGLG